MLECGGRGVGEVGGPLAHIKHLKRTNFPLEFLFDMLVIGAWVVDFGYTVILQSRGDLSSQQFVSVEASIRIFKLLGR